jgi:hypothetical protein
VVSSKRAATGKWDIVRSDNMWCVLTKYDKFEVSETKFCLLGNNAVSVVQSQPTFPTKLPANFIAAFFMLIYCVAYSAALKMAVIFSYETKQNMY